MPTTTRSPARSFTPAAPESERDRLQEHMTSTYFDLRMGMVVIGLLLPPVLVIGGLYLDPAGVVRPSISDYYNAVPLLRDLFVGAVVAIGFLLGLYKGFTNDEDNALNLAGVLAGVVALFPTGTRVHGPAAIAFFILIAYVCIFRAADTLKLLKDREKEQRYGRTYKLLGVMMAALPVLAAVLASMLFRSRVVLAVEWAALWVFAAYWGLKSIEYRETRAEKRAAAGELEVKEGPTLETARETQPGRPARKRAPGAFRQKAVVEAR